MSDELVSSSRKFQITMGLTIFLLFVTFGALYQSSSQGDFSETYPKGFRGGACTIENDAMTIGYSGYYLSSDYEIPENAIYTPNLAIQCGKMPGPGTLDISIDLLYPESIRDVSLALRLVKIEDLAENEEKDKSKSTVEERELLAVPAEPHASGVITHTLKLSELGHYTIYLSGKDASNKEFSTKIPLRVGQDWKDHFRRAVSVFLKKD